MATSPIPVNVTAHVDTFQARSRRAQSIIARQETCGELVVTVDGEPPDTRAGFPEIDPVVGIAAFVLLVLVLLAS